VAPRSARWRRYLRLAARYAYIGLQQYGASAAGVVLVRPPAVEPARPLGGGPATGHPERLVTHLPPTPAEVLLWADFGHRIGP
jgi:hypothetical protein